MLEKEEWFKKFCSERVHKISLMIYARTQSTVSFARRDLFYDRLIDSVTGPGTDEEKEDRYYAMEAQILGEHKFFTYRMWKFCGSTVMRLCYQVGISASTAGSSSDSDGNVVEIKVGEFIILRRRLFRALRGATDDADVNARVEAFYKKVLLEYRRRKGNGFISKK